ncbi:MAG: hypothetical protein AAFQ53_00150 [Bacteroidota bacterium]
MEFDASDKEALSIATQRVAEVHEARPFADRAPVALFIERSAGRGYLTPAAAALLSIEGSRPCGVPDNTASLILAVGDRSAWPLIVR